MSKLFKVGDRVRILNGKDNPGPYEFWVSGSMCSHIGQEGPVIKVTEDRPDGTPLFKVIPDGEEEGYFYYAKWLELAKIPFDVDKFAKYLRTPPNG